MTLTTENVAAVLASHLAIIIGNAQLKVNGDAQPDGLVLIARFQSASMIAMDADVVFHPTSALASMDSMERSVNNAFLFPDVFMVDVRTESQTRVNAKMDSPGKSVISTSTSVLLKNHVPTVDDAQLIRHLDPDSNVNVRSIFWVLDVKFPFQTWNVLIMFVKTEAHAIRWMRRRFNANAQRVSLENYAKSGSIKTVRWWDAQQVLNVIWLEICRCVERRRLRRCRRKMKKSK